MKFKVGDKAKEFHHNLVINNLSYEIKVVDEMEDDLCAKCDNINFEIVFTKALLKSQTLESVIVHELTHAFMYAYYRVNSEEKFDEEFVARFNEIYFTEIVDKIKEVERILEEIGNDK